MKKWRCKVCGYIHDGDNPPEMCPVCGVGSDLFEEVMTVTHPVVSKDVNKIVIIGNGAAGIEAAKTLRELNKDVEIQIFSDEPYPFYSRIHLSTLVGDEIAEKDIYIHSPEWYRELNIKVHLQTPILQIDPARNIVVDMLGREYLYDRLILANGAQAALPPIAGKGVEGVFVLRNMYEAKELRAFADSCKNAVVLGGGILGIETASSLNKLGLNVTVIELADHIMPAQLNKDAADILQKILESKGLQFSTDIAAKRIVGDFQAEGIELENGEMLPADMVVMATGIMPNTFLPAESGIEINRGVLVDDKLMTNIENIFAAGDVAEFNGELFGIWPAAVEQGIVAAYSALGINRKYEGTLPSYILKVAGIEVTTIGSQKISEKTKIILRVNTVENSYVKLIHNDESLLGATIVGLPGLGFRLEKLIKRSVNIREILPQLEKGEWEVLKKKK